MWVGVRCVDCNSSSEPATGVGTCEVCWGGEGWRVDVRSGAGHDSNLWLRQRQMWAFGLCDMCSPAPGLPYIANQANTASVQPVGGSEHHVGAPAELCVALGCGLHDYKQHL